MLFLFPFSVLRTFLSFQSSYKFPSSVDKPVSLSRDMYYVRYMQIKSVGMVQYCSVVIDLLLSSDRLETYVS